LHASQVALRTHHEVKLASLRSALVKVARGQGPDDATQHYFQLISGAMTKRWKAGVSATARTGRRYGNAVSKMTLAPPRLRTPALDQRTFLHPHCRE
jgi:hypothetical protein